MNGRFPAGERQHCAKSMDCNGSDAGATFIELIATLLPVNLYLVRPLWSMQTEKS